MRKINALNKREIEMIKMIAKGYTDKDIAAEFKITESGIRYLYSRILLKIGAYNRPHLVYRAFQENVLKKD